MEQRHATMGAIVGWWSHLYDKRRCLYKPFRRNGTAITVLWLHGSALVVAWSRGHATTRLPFVCGNILHMKKTIYEANDILCCPEMSVGYKYSPSIIPFFFFCFPLCNQALQVSSPQLNLTKSLRFDYENSFHTPSIFFFRPHVLFFTMSLVKRVASAPIAEDALRL